MQQETVVRCFPSISENTFKSEMTVGFIEDYKSAPSGYEL